MPSTITVQELQQLSASAIRALPRTIAIRSGEETVALLMPVREQQPVKKPSPELVASVMAQIDAAAAARTPEEQAEVEALLDERERAGF